MSSLVGDSWSLVTPSLEISTGWFGPRHRVTVARVWVQFGVSRVTYQSDRIQWLQSEANLKVSVLLERSPPCQLRICGSDPPARLRTHAAARFRSIGHVVPVNACKALKFQTFLNRRRVCSAAGPHCFGGNTSESCGQIVFWLRWSGIP
jgi:hypothetical protein